MECLCSLAQVRARVRSHGQVAGLHSTPNNNATYPARRTEGPARVVSELIVLFFPVDSAETSTKRRLLAPPHFTSGVRRDEHTNRFMYNTHYNHLNIAKTFYI